MMRPLLFILKRSFADPKAGSGMFFCPHSATVEGLLSFHPELRTRRDVRYGDFARPGRAVIAELGEANQACPALIPPRARPEAVAPGRRAEGRTFVVGATEIAGFLSEWAGIGMPHP
jgi:hypothetical protein